MAGSTEIYHSIVLEARSTKSRSQQGWCLVNTLKKNLYHGFLLASRGFQKPLAFLGLEIHHSNLCLLSYRDLPCVLYLLCYKYTSHIGFGIPPTLIWPHLKLYLQNKIIFWGSGWTGIWGWGHNSILCNSSWENWKQHMNRIYVQRCKAILSTLIH